MFGNFVIIFYIFCPLFFSDWKEKKNDGLSWKNYNPNSKLTKKCQPTKKPTQDVWMGLIFRVGGLNALLTLQFFLQLYFLLVANAHFTLSTSQIKFPQVTFKFELGHPG